MHRDLESAPECDSRSIHASTVSGDFAMLGHPLLDVGAGMKTGIAVYPAWTMVLRGVGRKYDVRTRVISGSD